MARCLPRGEGAGVRADLALGIEPLVETPRPARRVAKLLAAEVATAVFDAMDERRVVGLDLLLAEVGAHRAHTQEGLADRASLLDDRDPLARCGTEAEELHRLLDSVEVLHCELIPRVGRSRQIAARHRGVVAAEQESIRFEGHSAVKSRARGRI